MRPSQTKTMLSGHPFGLVTRQINNSPLAALSDLVQKCIGLHTPVPASSRSTASGSLPAVHVPQPTDSMGELQPVRQLREVVPQRGHPDHRASADRCFVARRPRQDRGVVLTATTGINSCPVVFTVAFSLAVVHPRRRPRTGLAGRSRGQPRGVWESSPASATP